MTMVPSLTMTNRMLDAVAALLTDGILEIRTGSPPASVEDAPGGTLICDIRLPLVPFTSASSGSAARAGDWYATARAAGTAGWFRLYDLTRGRWFDGTVSATGGGGDLQLATTAIEAGQVVQVTAFDLEFQS